MWNCMMCGKPALDTPRGAEIEPNNYNEYQDLGTVHWIAWVYCRLCDVWTQHPVVEEVVMNAEMVLKQFVETVNATGGIQRDHKGLHAPVADPEWIDLGEVYIEACRVLNVQKQVVDARTGMPIEA